MLSVIRVVPTRDQPALVERFLIPLAPTAVGSGWDVFVVDQNRGERTRAGSSGPAGWSIIYSEDIEIVHVERRTLVDALPLHYGYGYGAQTAKHTAADDGRALRFGSAEIVHDFGWLGRSRARGRLRAELHQNPFIAGFAARFARRRLSRV